MYSCNCFIKYCNILIDCWLKGIKLKGGIIKFGLLMRIFFYYVNGNLFKVLVFLNEN